MIVFAQVNGHVVITYDIGDGPVSITEDRQRFNDGNYHYVTFVRRRNEATVTVDDYPGRDVSAGIFKADSYRAGSVGIRLSFVADKNVQDYNL